MALTILKQPDIGEEFGRGLGTGLQTGLQSLLSSRLKQMEQRGISSGLQALGYSPQESLALSGLPSPVLQQIIKQLPQAEQRSFLQSQGLPPEIVSFAPPAQKAFIQQLLPYVQESELNKLLSESGPNYLAQQQAQNSQLLKEEQGLGDNLSLQEKVNKPQEKEEVILKQKEFTTEPNESFKETKKEIKDFSNAQPNDYELAPGAKGFREVAAIDKKLQNAQLSGTQRSLLKKQKEQLIEKAEKKQAAIDKRVDPYRRKLTDLAKGAEENNLTLEKMLRLINNDGVAGPLTGNILDLLKEGVTVAGYPLSLNIDLFGLTSSGTQEFKKLSTGLIRNVKDIFGSRISNQELRTFMDTIPTLNQSDEGKRRVIRDMRLLNEGYVLRKKAMDEILAENGGYAPHNLEDLVDKRSKQSLDKLSDQFRKSYVSPQELAREYKVRKRGLLGLPVSAVETLLESLRV